LGLAVSDYYVYLHVAEWEDDEAYYDEVVYVGKGKHHRAWCPDNRCEEHRKWMLDSLPTHLRPQFPHVGLTQEQALRLEEKLIREYEPKWNKQHNGKCASAKGEANSKAKLTEDEVLAIKYLLAPLMSGSEIAREFGVHKSSIYKIINNQNWYWL